MLRLSMRKQVHVEGTDLLLRMLRHLPADASPAAIAAAAVAAGEACGALPPLDGPQRDAVQSFFARTAEMLLGDERGVQTQLDVEALGAS